MSLRYLLDGYNMVMRLPELFEKTRIAFAPSREGLVQFLIRYRPQGSSRNRTTIVFDGYAELKLDWNLLRDSAIEVVFSEEESADDRIVSMVGKIRSEQRVVVTDDRELGLRVRDFGAKVVSVQDFVAKMVDQHPKTKVVHEEKKKKLTLTEEQKITEELKKIWLKTS